MAVGLGEFCKVLFSFFKLVSLFLTMQEVVFCDTL